MDVAERVRADRPPAGEGRLPPGLQWPAPLQTVAMLFASRPFNGLCERRFDGVMSSRLVGLGEMVVVWDPDLIRQVFTGDPDVFCAGQANEPVLGRPVGPNSVIVLDGERHLRTRKLLLPAFHGDAVRSYRDLVAEIAARQVERWPVDQPFAIHPHMQAITLEVILRAVIGTRDDERRAQLRSVLPGVAQANAAVLAAEARYPRIADSRLGGRLPWLRARRRAQALFCEEIAAHRADPEGRDDILAALMAARDADGRALTDDELRDQLATLLIAGQETTATALAWCFERLVRHPAALDRLRSEIIAANGDDYLGAVISETLRVRPVVDAVWRKLTAPIDLGGYRLPAGTVIAPSILGAHRTAFAKPDEFRPERHLDQPARPYTLIAFGGGTRRCIGASFALMEMKTILRTVLERVDLRAPTTKPERAARARGVTVQPARGARVIVADRQAAPITVPAATRRRTARGHRPSPAGS